VSRFLQAMILAATVVVIPRVAGGETLTFEMALEKAASQNEDVGILAEHVEQARAMRLQVLSGLLPWITATASFGFTEEVVIDTGGGESRVVVPGDDWGWGVQATVTLVDLGLIPSVAAAGKNKQAAEALMEYGREEVLYATAQAYVTALFAHTAVAVREQELETREKRKEEVEELMRADQALALDLKRAELQLLEAQKDLATARVESVLALDALCLLMGEPPGAPYELAPLESLAPGEPPGEQEAEAQVEQALEGRPDLEAAALSLSAAQSSKISSWLGILPTLSFSATYNQGPESFRSPAGYTWFVSFNATWTLFDGGHSVGEIMETSSKNVEAALELEKSEKEVQSEVRSAWLLFDLGLQNRDIAIKQLEVATATYDMATERYRAGVATGLEVDDALDDLAAAEMGLLGQELNLQLAWLLYLQVSGQFGDVFEVGS
jgi:multidrug efflux system outer membrane protein